MARARRRRPRLWQRHHAADHAADGAAPRHHQVQPEIDAQGHRRSAARFHRRLRRRQPQRDGQPQPVSVAGARRGDRTGARRLRASDAADAGLSRDLARRRAHRRRRGGGGRADLRQDLSAAQVQDRGGGAAVERRRRVRARSRFHRHPRQGRRGHRLERQRRRRHGHDPWRAGDLSAHRRGDGLLPYRGCGEGRRGGDDGAARLGRPQEPQACAAEIHHRGPRARRVPRRGRAPRRPDTRQAQAIQVHLDRRPLRLERGDRWPRPSHFVCAERPHRRPPRRHADDRAARNRRKFTMAISA